MFYVAVIVIAGVILFFFKNFIAIVIIDFGIFVLF